MNTGRSVLAGLAGTTVMTGLMLAGPKMGMPEMDLGAMLGNFLRIGAGAGWVTHFVIGTVLAVIYAAFFASRLPGATPVRGALYGLIVFFVAQLVAMPVMGGAVFSGGNLAMIVGSLLGHLIYGAVVGAIYGVPGEVAHPSPRTVDGAPLTP